MLAKKDKVWVEYLIRKKVRFQRPVKPNRRRVRAAVSIIYV